MAPRIAGFVTEHPHVLRPAEHVTLTNAATADLMWDTAACDVAAFDGDHSHERARCCGSSDRKLGREAQGMTHADAFHIIAACFAVATVMVPLMTRVAPPKGPSADAH